MEEKETQNEDKETQLKAQGGKKLFDYSMGVYILSIASSLLLRSMIGLVINEFVQSWWRKFKKLYWKEKTDGDSKDLPEGTEEEKS